LKALTLHNFKDYWLWQGTDPVIIARLHNQVVKALRAPDTLKRLVDDGGNEIIGSSPNDFAAQIQNELKMCAK
jgi:tripartite-type tricarboxylate transporter receptor subunit TctC